MYLTREKGKVSAAINFEFDVRLSGKSLMYIRKSSRQRIESSGILIVTYFNE